MARRAAVVLETILLAAAVAGPGPFAPFARAQVVTEEATITGFTIPEVDDDGTVRWKIMGEQARLKPNTPADITKMRMELYKNEQVDMVLTADQCFYDRDKREAETETPVKIEGKNVVITGRGFYWSGTNNLLVIRHDARVLVNNPKSFVKPEPAETNPPPLEAPQ